MAVSIGSSKEDYVKIVKNAGHMIAATAEDIVGDIDNTYCITITITLNPAEIATIKILKEKYVNDKYNPTKE